MKIEFESIDEVLAFAERLQAPAAEVKPAPEVKPVAEAKPAPETKRAEKAVEVQKEGRTESEVRVVFAEKLKGGKKTEVKAIFAKYGVAKLSELLEKHGDKLDQIYEEAEAI